MKPSPVIRIQQRPKFHFVGALLILTLALAVPAMIVQSTPALRITQTLFGLIPDTLHIGDAAIRPRKDWTLRASRDEPGGHARLWGVLPLPTTAEEDPFPSGRFYRFEFDGECAGQDVVLLEMAPTQAAPVKKLFDLPLAEVASAGFQLGRYGQWNVLRPQEGSRERRFMMIPELRVSLGFFGDDLSPCVPAEVFSRAEPQPVPLDPLGVVPRS